MAKMNMDIYNKIVKQIQEGKAVRAGESEAKKYVKITTEKQTFRFLPTEDGEPLKIIAKHYLGKGNDIWCPKKSKKYLHGVSSECPVCDFTWKLYDEAKAILKGRKIKEISDEEFALNPKLKEAVETLRLKKELDANEIIFANVIVRGQEEEGVKTVNLTMPTFKKIMLLMQESLDEDNKDFCDPEVGSDFKIFKDANSTKTFPEIQVLWGGVKPLSKDKQQAEKWLKNVQLEPIPKEEYPNVSLLENAMLKRFKVSEKDAESFSAESSIESAESAKETEDLDLDDLSRSIEELQ